MRLVITSIAVLLLLVVVINGYEQDQADVEDQELSYNSRNIADDEMMESPFLWKRKMPGGLVNTDVLKVCQNACAYLQVKSTDLSKRSPYKQCQDKCVNEVLTLMKARKCPQQKP